MIYKLLSDKRLNNKLYAFEVSYLVVFVQEISVSIYETLVEHLLKLRQLSDEKLAKKFNKDRHAYVNSAYEWDYYVSTLFQSTHVLDKTQGNIICKLQHGNTATFRKVTRNAVSIPQNLIPFVEQLEINYSYLDKPLILNDAERLKLDITKEIYNFYPNILLSAIGESSDIGDLLELPKLIEQYSNNPENETAYLFEDILVEGFNMFCNVEAKRIGGAGHTDLECLYLTKKKKFAVEAKSTTNKLLGISVGRLREHREKIGGEYTIVVTPRYVPATKRDIIGTPIVIILASTFAEYLFNCIEHDEREIDYNDFDEIIINNLGKDISRDISTLTISKFAVTGKQ